MLRPKSCSRPPQQQKECARPPQQNENLEERRSWGRQASDGASRSAKNVRDEKQGHAARPGKQVMERVRRNKQKQPFSHQ